jgi:hypothetical protein
VEDHFGEEALSLNLPPNFGLAKNTHFASCFNLLENA